MRKRYFWSATFSISGSNTAVWCPKGFVRTLGKLAELTDRGVRVVFFTGNHDMWVGDYLTRECGMEVCTSPQVMTLAGKKSSSPTATT